MAVDEWSCAYSVVVWKEVCVQPGLEEVHHGKENAVQIVRGLLVIPHKVGTAVDSNFNFR